MFKRTTQAKESLPPTVEDAEKQDTILPKSYYTHSLLERRLLLAVRMMTIGFILVTCLAIILGLTLFSLLPLKEVRPFLVRVMDEGTVVADVRPIESTFDAQSLLTEKLVRDYVAIRHEILRSTDVMAQRWSEFGQMGMMSSVEEYDRFRLAVAPLLEQIRQEGAQSLVTILSVVPITEGRSYVVDFRLTTYDDQDRITDDSVYTATIEVEYQSYSNRTRNELLINPTGFTVVAYSVAEKSQ